MSFREVLKEEKDKASPHIFHHCVDKRNLVTKIRWEKDKELTALFSKHNVQAAFHPASYSLVQAKPDNQSWIVNTMSNFC